MQLYKERLKLIEEISNYWKHKIYNINQAIYGKVLREYLKITIKHHCNILGK